MEDKQREPHVESTHDQPLDTQDNNVGILINLNEEECVSRDGEEDRGEGSSLPTQPTGTAGDSLSLSSEGSENESLRSKVPRLNCPEHIVSET